MKLQMMFGPTFLRGHVSMLGEGEGPTNQTDKPLCLAFGGF